MIYISSHTKGIQASPLPQSVGLVCFGEDTKVLSRCCTDFLNLKQMISEYSFCTLQGNFCCILLWEMDRHCLHPLVKNVEIILSLLRKLRKTGIETWVEASAVFGSDTYTFSRVKMCGLAKRSGYRLRLSISQKRILLL